MSKPSKLIYTPSETSYDLECLKDTIPESGPKIIFADIETSMMLGYFFGTFKQNIGLGAIKQDWNILSFAAKWHGPGRPTLYQSIRNQKNPVNDFGLCKSLAWIIDNADIIVAHNGVRFDMKKIRARMAHNRMRPVRNTRVIDTLLESRKQFAFTSQKLIYLSEKFGPDGMKKNSHGSFAGIDLWVQCQNGNQLAWDEMEAYNIPDVLALEGVYDELSPWFQGAQNLAVFHEHEEGVHRCPNCGSSNVKKDGLRRTQVTIFQQYKCKDCGGYSRGRKGILPTHHVLVN